ncbi:GntR family transcriptional regulator [Mycolicibacterium komossense]|uniref:GntR family transcriptional regulator n=1 Tax=Mycolicibacterium komossense TaxID=1779 RepID=A0ABT3C5H3_9MYCO|nr:GntR family transcriptional regulator [Mycolicibacterium komossense]MCV7224729.1 GntR family transcriptional regulator [Mycolicibacterium komossense]
MPKKYGLKEKDLVVAHVINLILTGKVRTGDRIDRNLVAKDLGVSRVPIQEAVVQLEHDGIISTRYHRGAFIERFDEAVILEHHEVYGMLNGLVSERAAADPDCQILEGLESLLATMKSTRSDAQLFQQAGWDYRRLIYETYAGPRLLALILASQSFMPPAFRPAYLVSNDEMVEVHVAETDAIRRHDPVAARAANLRRAELLGSLMRDELVRRGVLKTLHSE